MNRSGISFKFAAAAALLTAITASPWSFAQQNPQTLDGKTAGQVFKNLKVLGDAPADQFTQSMHLIKAALGMDCEECHVAGDFASDAKGPKIIARQMMLMVADLNRSSFNARPEVTCYTCHHGNRSPASAPPLPLGNASIETAAALPSVDQILARYVEALGGEQNLRKISSRIILGTQYIATGPGGVVPVPAEIERDWKAPNLVVTTYRTPSYVLSEGFDGSVQWSQNIQGRVLEAGRVDQQRARRAADFYEPLDLKEEYIQMTVAGIKSVGDRAAYVVVALPQDDLAEQLYFDTENGLLLRKRTALQTPAGASPFQITYSDYRDTGSGVKFPFLIKMDPAGPRVELGTTATVRVTKVQDNVPIADTKFMKPQSKETPPRRP